MFDGKEKINEDADDTNENEDGVQFGLTEADPRGTNRNERLQRPLYLLQNERG